MVKLVAGKATTSSNNWATVASGSDGQQAVLKQLLKKMSAKLGDHGAKAELVQRPGRVFAAGAAAKVLARQQRCWPLVARLVQHKVGVGLALAFGMPGSPLSR